MKKAKMDRIDLRISSSDKAIIEMAAASKRLSLSSYMVSASMEIANRDLAQQETLVLSEQDWNQLVDLLDNPPELNDELKKLLHE